MDIGTEFTVQVQATKDVLGKGENKYVVPRFQRTYAWTKNEIGILLKDLFDDLDLISRNPANPQNYFLGPLVVTETDNMREVLDGQQRLTTISLILALLSHRLEELDHEKASIIRGHVLDGQLKGADQPILTLQNTDNELFRRLLENPEDRLSDAEKKTNLGKAIRQIQSFITNQVEVVDGDSAGEAHIYVELANRVLEHVSFVIIDAPSKSSAFALFETLNHRGLPLNPADLIKNTILEEVGDRYRTAAADDWDMMSDAIGITETVDFIRYFWISKFEFVRKNELFDVAQKEITNRNPKEIYDLVSEMKDQAILYKHILDPSPNAADWPDHWNDSLSENLTRLDNFGARSCRPLLLATSGDEDDFRLAAEFAETVTLRFSVIQKGNPNVLEGIYSDTCRKIREGMNLDRALKGHVETLDISDEQFERAALLARMKKSHPRWRRILIEINRKISAGETEVLGPGTVQIEHIMPQTSTFDWLESTGLSEEEYQSLVGALGNLTLFHGKRNKKVSNKSILEKMEEYKKSDIPLTLKLVRELCSEGMPLWGKNEIEERTYDLVSLMTEIWSIKRFES